MKKRLLSLGLALVMLLSLLPTSVLATDYGYGATAPAQYAVGDTIVVLRWGVYDLPDGNNIPDDTQWVKIGESNCNNPAHWGKGWRSHNDECNWGGFQEWGTTYGQFQLVSTATPEQPDPEQPDPDQPDDDTPGKVTASKTAVDNGNGTYTITLSVQGNKTTATTARDSDVVLLVDNSTSMTQNHDRLTPAKNAAKQFVNTLLADGKNNRVAVYGFAGKDRNGGANDSGAFTVEKGLMVAANKDELLSAINGMATDSNKNATNYTAALAKAKSILDERLDKTRNGVVVFITDGAPSAPSSTNDRGDPNWNGFAEAAAIKTAKYTLYTIGINISGNDLTYLNSLASSGCNYNVNDSNLETQLTGILSDIAYQIREVAAGTSAKIEDVVNLDDYEFDLGTDGEPVIECSAGTSATVDKTTGKVTWTIGDIPDGTAATCKITVKANNTTALREQAADKHTNKSVKLSYYVGEDEVERTNLGDPHFKLPANAAKYTVNHFKATADGTYPTTASETETLGPVLYGTEITPASVKKNYTGYAFDHADKAKLTVSSTAASNVINLYYGLDAHGTNNPDQGDGVPDSRQTKVTYTITNGTWGVGGSSAAIEQWYTVETYNAATNTWSDVTPAPTLANVPTNMTPKAGFDAASGSWSTPAPAAGTTTVGKTAQSYNYSFGSQLTYTVTYSAGTLTGVTGLPASATVAHGGSHVVSSSVPVSTAADLTFVCWKDQSGNEYAAGNTISNITSDITLTAYWKQNTYKLIYNGNAQSGGTVSNVPTDNTNYVQNDARTLSTTVPTHSAVGGKDVLFVGWSMTKTDKIFSKGETSQLPELITSVKFNKADITVYAVWSYDVIGGEDGGGNGRADVYEAVVTYKVVNGKWSDNSTADKTEVVLLAKQENGSWSGKLASVPTPQHGTGYTDAVSWTKDGASCDAPTTSTTVTGDTTFTATYANRAKVVVTYDPGEAGSAAKNMPTSDSPYFGDDYTLSTKVPTWDGHKFTGWQLSGNTYQPGGKYENIQTHIKFEAQWADAYTLIYKNPLVATDTDVTETHHTTPVTLKTAVGFASPELNRSVFLGWSTTNPGKILDKGDTLPALVTSVTFSDEITTRTVYAVWAYDKTGAPTAQPTDPQDPNKPDKPNGTADILEATITYQVVNGTWSDDTTAPKYQVVTIKNADGSAVSPAPQLSVPTVKANEGFKNGSWSPAIPADKAITGDKTYTYTFVPSSLTVDPTDPDGNPDTDDAWVKKNLTVSGSFGGETFTVTVTPVVNGGDSAGNIIVGSGSSFEVVSNSYTGKVTMTAADTKAFVFDENNHITFTKAGEYLFTVVETKGSTPGMTYDATEYTLKVKVVEGEKGLELGEVETVTVKNSFYRASAPSGGVRLEKGTHFNYVMGYSDGTIRPNNEITRGEVAIIFFRLLTDESRKEFYSEHNDFTDVPETSKSNIAISTLTNAGILTGYSDGTFRPNAKVTRGQLAAIIARFADMKGDVDKTFSDIDNYWAKDLILLAASNGWIDGYSDGTFRPANNITRAQTMAIINRALDRQVSHVEDLLDEDEMNVWVDNMDPDAWYYFHVQEATNNHTYTRKKANSLDEKWTAKLKDIDWSVYQF